MPVDIVVITVNYNGSQFITMALQHTRAALSLSGFTYRIFVVDNGSTDDSSKALGQAMPEIEVLSLNPPGGFAVANNFGVHHAPESRFLLFLNPDAWLLPGTLEELIHFLETDSRYGAVAPAEQSPEGDLRRTWWPLPTPESFLFMTLFSSLFPLRSPRPHKKIVKVAYLPGFCLLIRRSVFHEIGEWDEQFPLYSEDVDLGYRAGRAGYHQAILLDAPAMHIGSAASKEMPNAEKMAKLAQARVLFWYKHFTARARLTQTLMRYMVFLLDKRAKAITEVLRLHLVQPAPDVRRSFSKVQPPIEASELFRVSVVIPSYNRLAALQRALPSYIRARLVDEVVIVLDGTADVPKPLVDEMMRWGDRIRCITTMGKHLGAAGCRMIGARSARHNWILFGEDDVELEPDYVLRLAAHAQHNQRVIVAGRILGCKWEDPRPEVLRRAEWRVGPPINQDWIDSDFSRRCPGIHDVPYLHSIALVPRGLVLDLGFEEHLYYGNQYREETDFYVRARHAGYRLIWDNETVCYHCRDLSHVGGQSMGCYRRLFWVLINNWRFMSKNAAILRQDYGVASPRRLAVRFSLRTVWNFVSGELKMGMKRLLGIRGWSP
jgi:GT2 family glycosyltransferase